MTHDTPVKLKCQCGALRGELHDPAQSIRAICYCDDCQLYVERLGRPDVVDAHGGTELLQVTPRQVRIDEGREHIACLRLYDKGIYRWYSRCCRTPIGNTLSRPRFAFIGVPLSFVAEPEALSQPVEFRIQGRFARGGMPANTAARVPIRHIAKIAAQLAIGAARRAHRPSPFFGPDGEPVVGRPVPVVREPL